MAYPKLRTTGDSVKSCYFKFVDGLFPLLFAFTKDYPYTFSLTECIRNLENPSYNKINDFMKFFQKVHPLANYMILPLENGWIDISIKHFINGKIIISLKDGERSWKDEKLFYESVVDFLKNNDFVKINSKPFTN